MQSLWFAQTPFFFPHTLPRVPNEVAIKLQRWQFEAVEFPLPSLTSFMWIIRSCTIRYHKQKNMSSLSYYQQLDIYAVSLSLLQFIFSLFRRDKRQLSVTMRLVTNLHWRKINILHLHFLTDKAFWISQAKSADIKTVLEIQPFLKIRLAMHLRC